MIRTINAHALKGLAGLDPGTVQTCITSPPYWGLRNYGTPPVKWPAVRYAPMAGLKAISVKAWEGELGSEPDLESFVGHIVSVFRAVHRVLKEDGTLWVNMGDSYSEGGRGGNTSTITGHGKNASRMDAARGTRAAIGPKQLMGQPWRVAMALQADGWTLRQDIIWAKPNPMPESAGDRCTKAHEYLFFLSKRPRYFSDFEAIREPVSETGCGIRQTFRGGGGYAQHALVMDNGASVPNGVPGNTRPPAPGDDTPALLDVPSEAPAAQEGRSGASALRGQGAERDRPGGAANREDRDPPEGDGSTRNKRSWWEVATRGFSGAHFATYPAELIRPCVLASSRPGDIVLDPFGGTGTTGAVALEEGRQAIMIELNPGSFGLMAERLGATTPGLGI